MTPKMMQMTSDDVRLDDDYSTFFYCEWCANGATIFLSDVKAWLVFSSMLFKGKRMMLIFFYHFWMCPCFAREDARTNSNVIGWEKTTLPKKSKTSIGSKTKPRRRHSRFYVLSFVYFTFWHFSLPLTDYQSIKTCQPQVDVSILCASTSTLKTTVITNSWSKTITSSALLLIIEWSREENPGSSANTYTRTIQYSSYMTASYYIDYR